MIDRIISEKYRVIRELGRGGMGTIYEALHISLNRTVAIKILHPQYTSDPAFLKRLHREARSMARLNHDAILGVFDVAEDLGSHYIVMEYFQGKDLKQIILEEGPLSHRKALSIALQVAKALSYAHAHGIIHRDIKPSNIMINDAGEIKIADFGIAAATGEVAVTAIGQVIGTLEYMSVEQAQGKELDGRTDLYSLGMVIHELVTGETTFGETAGVAILGKLLYDKEEFDLSFQSDIPLPLQDLVRNLLKKKRDDRVPDAATLIERITNVVSELDEPKPSETLEQANLGQTLMFKADESAATAIFQESSSGIKESEDPSLGSSSLQETLNEPSSQTLNEPSSPVVSEKTQSSETINASLARTIAKKKSARFIAVASLVVIILTAIIYMLPSTEDKEVPSPPSLPPPTVPSLVDDIREIQSALREIQSELVLSQREADVPNVHLWAKELYDEALDLKNKGSTILKDGNDLVGKEHYALAKERLVSANSILTQAQEGFLKAKQTAEVRIVQEEKSKIEKENQKQQQATAQLERLRQERATAERERGRQEEAVRIEEERLRKEEDRTEKGRREQARLKTEREKLVQEEKTRQERTRGEEQRRKQEKIARIEREKILIAKNKAIKKTSPPTPGDFDALGGILNRLQHAYENKDLATLQKMSQIPADRSQFLTRLFQDFETINISVGELSIIGNSAYAIISITKLTSNKSNIAPPSKKMKDAKLTIHKEKGKWGKVVW